MKTAQWIGIPLSVIAVLIIAFLIVAPPLVEKSMNKVMGENLINLLLEQLPEG